MIRNTIHFFMAAGENGVNPTLLMPQARQGWEAGVEGWPVGSRLGPVGCLGMATVQHPAKAGFSSACSNYVDSLSHLCPFGSVMERSKARGFFESQRYPFASVPGLRV